MIGGCSNGSDFKRLHHAHSSVFMIYIASKKSGYTAFVGSVNGRETRAKQYFFLCLFHVFLEWCVGNCGSSNEGLIRLKIK